MATSPGARPVRIEVVVALKPGVADAEAETIQRSLGLLGIDGVRSVRTARTYTLEFDGVTPQEARRRAEDAVERLLANPVIHAVRIVPSPD